MALSAPLWIPLLAFAALGVLVADGRPVLFRQERAGLRGKPFTMLKLRTMRSGSGTDAERMTAFGRFLSGKMALVGPRPLPTAYLPRYSPEQARRHEVRPGITGWAQVNGRNAISWDEKFRLDVWYVDHRSLALDARIIAMTLLKTASRDGICHPGSDTMDEFLG